MDAIWYLVGDPDVDGVVGFPTLFESKTCAEQYARVLFPTEDVHAREARIRFRPVFTYYDLNGE